MQISHLFAEPEPAGMRSKLSCWHIVGIGYMCAIRIVEAKRVQRSKFGLSVKKARSVYVR